MMNEQNRAKELLLHSRAKAESEFSLLNSQTVLAKEFLYDHLLALIRYKFLLEPEECTNDDLTDMVNLSLSKSMGISKDLVKEFDRAQTCDGASSATAKRILLLMALQKGFGITISPDAAAEAKTVKELAAVIWADMQESPNWSGRLAL